MSWDSGTVSRGFHAEPRSEIPAMESHSLDFFAEGANSEIQHTSNLILLHKSCLISMQQLHSRFNNFLGKAERRQWNSSGTHRLKFSLSMMGNNSSRGCSNLRSLARLSPDHCCPGSNPGASDPLSRPRRSARAHKPAGYINSYDANIHALFIHRCP